MMLDPVSGSTAIASLFQQQQFRPVAGATGSPPAGNNAGSAAQSISSSQIHYSSGLDSVTLSALVQTQQVADPNTQNAGSAYQQGRFQTDFQNVIGAIQSGDVKTAQAAFSVISQLNAGTNGVTFDSIGVPKEFQGVLQQIGNSLQSGDIGGARQVLGPVAFYQQGSFQTDMQNVAGALQSGDLKGAQTAFSVISQLNAGNNGVTFDSIGVPKAYQDALKQIGDNLQSGDLTGAQQALAPLSYRQGIFQADLQNVVGALQSGDVASAQTAYSVISQLNAGTNGVTFDSIGVPKELQDVLGRIGNSLQSGDLTGAQGALAPLFYQQGSFQADFQNVASALQSGDVKAAQAAYSAISQLNAGNNGVSFHSIGVPQGYQDALKQIGDSLQSSDIAGARQALASLQVTAGG